MLTPRGCPAPSTVLQQQAEVFDEAVQLKTLQTVLTILQCKSFPDDEQALAMLLGLCFRLLGSSWSSDSVYTTAAATLRWAVALIFDRVLVGATPPPEGGEPVEVTTACTQTALSLFDDLCHLPGGSAATWLQVQPMLKVIALDMLEFVLS